MKRGKSTAAPTKAERARLDALSKMPCVCCELEKVRQYGRTYIHHIVDKGYRRLSGGHDATLPLCRWHHQGHVPFSAGSARSMKLNYGPSLELNKREFRDVYGSERDLLAIVDAKLMVRKVLPDHIGDRNDG